MPPQAVQLAIFLIQQLITHEPEIAAEIKALLTKADPTDDEWKALHDKVIAKGYRDYVPASALPPVLPVNQPAAAPALAVTPATAPVPAIAAEPVPITVLPPPLPAASQPGPAQADPQSGRPVTKDIPKAVSIAADPAGRVQALGGDFDPKVTAAAQATPAANPS